MQLSVTLDMGAFAIRVLTFFEAGVFKSFKEIYVCFAVSGKKRSYNHKIYSRVKSIIYNNLFVL